MSRFIKTNEKVIIRVDSNEMKSSHSEKLLEVTIDSQLRFEKH